MRTVVERIESWAGRDCGASRRDLRDACAPGQRDEFTRTLDEMIAAGQVHSVKHPSADGRMASTRFFTDEVQGALWAASVDTTQRERAAPPPRPKLPSRRKLPLRRLKLTDVAHNLLQRPNGGEAVIPAGVRVTICPSAPVYSRHQLPPGERVIGGFASMGIGRYLDGSAP